AIVPADADDLADVLASGPAATMVAGATDVGVWVNKDLRDIVPAVFIGHLDGLCRIEVSDEAIEIGAAASYSDVEAALTAAVPGLADYWSRIGGWQIRNMGTVGGNIANGSPIADLPPVLIALGAELILRRGAERRAIPLEDYFIAYGQQDLNPGEFVEAVRVPKPPGDAYLGFYKVSKRRDEDISSVCAGFMVRVRDACIEDARLAFGGMAATPKRARAGEAALCGRNWDEPAVEAARQALGRDFTPISDWRASAEYRALVARNLLTRFYLDRSPAGSP
ncbi:MAG: FAD binding domain-containing protein, partial [Alphaproteobacteria bacterium]|nr:FAD binding domain-containing protein [Alphaproteobacteria bacterium]